VGGSNSGGTWTPGGGTVGGADGGTPGSGGLTGGQGSEVGGASPAGGTLLGSGGTSPGCAGPVPGTQGKNPLFSELFTADPAALVHNCTFYITAGHDEGTTGFNLNDWYVLSSTDMVNWSDNGGPVMGLGTFAWANANAWAGQMVERDGKFYWYVPVNEAGGGMAIGVAVADSPLGPFQDAIGKPLVNDAVEMAEFGFNDPGQTVYTIDPTVFIDDDGQAYLLYGGFWRLVSVPLGDDMISLAGEMTENTPPDFFEAPFLTKRDATYYLAYAAGSNPATIDYVTSPSPTGPWTNHGRILDELPALPNEDAPTSHPALMEFLGQWYFIYHLSNGPGGGTYRRQVAIEKLTFDSDGTIQKVIPTSGISF
jgi:beta-xylosidase